MSLIRKYVNHPFIFTYGAPIIFLIALHTPLETFISKILVEPIFSTIISSQFYDIIFFVLSIYIIANHQTKLNGYVLSENGLLTIFFTSSVYLYYREASDVWKLTKLNALPVFRYLDLILVYSLSYMLMYVKHSFRKKVAEPTVNGFFDDAPLTTKSNDKLGFEPHAKTLVEKMGEITPINSFAIGINGKWGTGKTSFLNLIKSNLDDEQYIAIDFKPWNSYDTKKIIQDFFHSFQTALDQYHSNLPRLLGNYSKKLLSLESSGWTNMFGEIRSNIIADESIISIQGDINKALERFPKKIIVFIDDVDRLDNEEIGEIIRLIRNTANFTNTFFVVAYDREYVLSALQHLNTHNHQRFLEKIFQLEVNLPYYDQNKLLNELLEKLKKMFPERFHEKLKTTILGQNFGSAPVFLQNWVLTLRDVTRLANGCSLNMSKLLHEVEFSDFIGLEMLRQKFPLVYELLYRQTERFLVIDTNNLNHATYRLTTMSTKDKKSMMMPGDTSDFEAYIRGNTKELDIGTNDIEHILQLIVGFFGTKSITSIKEKNLCINNPRRFKLYFSYYLGENNLPEELFEQARIGIFDSFSKQIDLWFEKDLSYDLLQKFYEVNSFKNKDEFENIIRGIMHLSRKELNGRPYGLDYKDFAQKLTDYRGSINNKLYNGNTESFHKLIKSFFNSATSPYVVESEFIKHLNAAHDDLFPLDKDERLDIVHRYFSEYVESMTEWTTSVWDLFHCCSYPNWHYSSGVYTKGEKIFTPKSKMIIKKAIFKDQDGFLRRIVQSDHFSNEEYLISEVVLMIFDTYEKFIEFVDYLEPTESKYLDEFKVFLNLLMAKSFNGSIKFDFDKIPVKEKLEDSIKISSTTVLR